MSFGLPATFRLGLDRAIPLIESVEAIPVVLLGMPGSGVCIRWLLRGATRAGEGGTFAESTADDNGKPPDDTLLEIRGRCWGAALFFPVAFDIFDGWAGPRDVFATGCPSLWEGSLLPGRDACPVVGRRTRLPVRNRGEFGGEGERSASPFSNPVESTSVDGPC